MMKKIVLLFLVFSFYLVEAKDNREIVADSIVQTNAEKLDTIQYPSVEELGEIIVKGKARLTSLTDNGFVYRMAGNKRAQDENILQALSYVPLINIDGDGDIKVQGSSSYSLYLDGRPYEMAQKSPKAFLESLPASSISKVEVITKPSNDYAPTDKRYIINIILKSPFVEGYVASIGGGGNTQPKANGNVMGMIKRGKIEASMTYDYNLNGQRNQPVNIVYSKPNSTDNNRQEWEARSKGDGNWQTHTMRAMLKWSIDSLNTLYADAHARINRTDLTGKWEENSPANSAFSHFNNINDYTAGTAEANVMFRNYSAKNKNTEKLTIGYHFTYNPDKRNLVQEREGGNTYQITEGGMREHTGLGSWLWTVHPQHKLRFTVKDIYRHGNTDSKSIMSLGENENFYSMSYRNNIMEGRISYTGRVGNTWLYASLAVNEDHFKMHLPQDASNNFSNNHFYLMPSASAYWSLGERNTFQLDYSTSIARPTVQMLNPYTNINDGYSVSRGNPLLKAEYKHNISLDWTYNGSNNLTLFLRTNYAHSNDVIQFYKYHDTDSKLVSTYGNLGSTDEVSFMWNLQWNYWSWLNFSVNGNAGKRFLSAKSINLSQRDWFYNITPQIDFLLPNHYRLGSSMGIYHNVPAPWTTQNTLTMYSFYASKSFLKGKLNVSVMANSPFSKYHKNIVDTRLSDIRVQQTNYLTARSFGLNISYSFGSGQKVSLRRDRMMQSTDQATGVN